jgi:hypothetical protein
MSEIEPGATFTALYPFTRTEVELWDTDGLSTVPSWRPGARAQVYTGPDSAAPACHAEGQAEYHVISRHKPGRFPERVFYTRVFITPGGFRFDGPKSRALRWATVAQFKRMIAGHPFDYVVEPDAPQ